MHYLAEILSYPPGNMSVSHQVGAKVDVVAKMVPELQLDSDGSWNMWVEVVV